jgi:thymidylate kinase
MLILLEGGECTGKTSLALELAKSIPDVESYHSVKPLPHVEGLDLEDHYYRDIADYAPGSGRHLIYDRGHVGDIIYGPLWGTGANYTLNMARRTERWLESLGALLLHLDVPLSETIRRRQLLAVDDNLPYSEFQATWNFYSRYCLQSPWCPLSKVPGGPSVRNILKLARDVENFWTGPWRG